MGSRDKDQTTPHHQPLLSSLVVRPSVRDGGDGAGGGGLTGGSDYEPGEFLREPPSYSRPERYSDDPGYRLRAGSGSPVRRKDADHRYNSDFDNSGADHRYNSDFDNSVGPSRGRDFSNRKYHGRFQDSSPPYARGRGFDGPGLGPGSHRGEDMGMGRNNPNVRPREGDWICTDALCGNLNFARRDFCNHCKRPRYRSGGSPRRGYPGPPPLHAPPRHFPGPSLDLSPGRTMNGYRSPPRDWARDRPRDYGSGGPPPRQGGRFSRFSDHEMRRDRSDYADDEYRGRNKFDRPMPMDWGHNDHGRDSFFHERKGFERQPPSPPLPPPSLPQRGRWGREGRDRSRSPISTTKRVHNMYMEQGWRDDRHRVGRGRMRDVY
uniref:RNA-binding family protein n=1 Tax=Populus tomentosa TaxID=118781 RepID=A0A1L6K5S3_POPTO|nr:RNA-binding family protein [Populus tomentosa]